MNEMKISRKFRIDAGHRVYGHEGKCANLHGHSYEFEFFFTAPKLDNLGRIIDFGVIKERIHHFLETKWDHGMILWENDPATVLFQKGEMLEGHKVFIMSENPTAENMASFLLDHFGSAFIGVVKLIAVRCQETPNCCAVVSIGD